MLQLFLETCRHHLKLVCVLTSEVLKNKSSCNFLQYTILKPWHLLQKYLSKIPENGSIKLWLYLEKTKSLTFEVLIFVELFIADIGINNEIPQKVI